MAEQEKKEQKYAPTSVEEAMKLYAKLDREGKLPTDTIPFSMSPKVMDALRRKSKNTESK